MANGFYVTQAVAQAMITAFATAADAGTAAVIEIYAGAVPANADATPSSPTLLASLTCSASISSGISDTGTAARLTFAAITSDTSADNTGTAAYFRIKTQTGGTVVAQGTVGTCCIITTAANSLMRPLHDRMPAILTPADYAHWLDPDNPDPDSLVAILQPADSARMAAYPVTLAVNDTRNDDPRLIEPLSEAQPHAERLL